MVGDRRNLQDSEPGVAALAGVSATPSATAGCSGISVIGTVWIHEVILTACHMRSAGKSAARGSLPAMTTRSGGLFFSGAFWLAGQVVRSDGRVNPVGTR